MQPKVIVKWITVSWVGVKNILLGGLLSNYLHVQCPNSNSESGSIMFHPRIYNIPYLPDIAGLQSFLNSLSGNTTGGWLAFHRLPARLPCSPAWPFRFLLSGSNTMTNTLLAHAKCKRFIASALNSSKLYPSTATGRTSQPSIQWQASLITSRP